MSGNDIFFVRCADTFEERFSDQFVPRGRGGVCMLWHKSLTKHIKKLDVGNERIQAIQLQTQNSKIIIINVYMPTFESNSIRKYKECLDILNAIMSANSKHDFIICGDFNASLSENRSNKHDKLFKTFVCQNQLSHTMPSLSIPTFIQHSGNGSSQIDYILSANSQLLGQTRIDRNDFSNTSAHTSISARVYCTLPENNGKNQRENSRKAEKILWDSGNVVKYQQKLLENLQNTPPSEDIDETISNITQVIKKCTKLAFPTKVMKFKGPKLKISPTTLSLVKESKQILRAWRNAGAPRGDHTLFKQKKKLKRLIRKQIRTERAIDKSRFYNKLMATPDTSFFYKLIKRNTGKGKSQVQTTIIDKNIEIENPVRQTETFAEYYEQLAVPSEDPSFNDEFLDLCSFRCTLIEQLADTCPDPVEPFTCNEVEKAIKNLNNNKAADEYGITAEHVKYAGEPLLNMLTHIFNTILTSRKIPDTFRTGYITPVHKKGKDPQNVGNYRGITVASLFGKIFEYVLLQRLPSMNSEQSNLQFGFTKNTSPTIASFIMSEASLDAKRNNSHLHIATLDSQKAFDVVSHPILLDKLFHSGANLTIWKLVKGMYEGLTSKVKWQGNYSDSFPIHQGVKQGGILSTHLYKLYINDLLLTLEEHKLGKHIGVNYSGCPTCADDLSLMSECTHEFQTMLNISQQYACNHRYTIHPEKSVVVTKGRSKKVLEEEKSLTLGNKQITLADQTKHLGLIRTVKQESKINTLERISLARRTLYTLLNVGAHGNNGLNPKISYKIYQCYVLPRLLHSLETLSLNKTDLEELELFHRKTLKSLQSLPPNTATSAVLLLLGALPIEGELHKRQLSLLYNILQCKNGTVSGILTRQLAVYKDDPDSFCGRISNILELYNLPRIENLIANLPLKTKWKHAVKTAVNNHWTAVMRSDLSERSTLSLCNINELQVGKVHHVWNSIDTCVLDVKKGIVKARMLTGVYNLQLQKAKFSKSNVDAKCTLCCQEDEDIMHILTRCPVYQEERDMYVKKMKTLIDHSSNPTVWDDHITSRAELVKLIIDNSVFINARYGRRKQALVHQLESLSRNLCYRIHNKRLISLDAIS